MNVAEKTLYNLFRKELKLPDESAASFVEAMEDCWEFERIESNNSSATKEDIRKLELNLETMALAAKDDMHRLELKIEQSKNETNLKIEQSKIDTYKAIFLSGLLQFLGILGGRIAIVKFMK